MQATVHQYMKSVSWEIYRSGSSAKEFCCGHVLKKIWQLAHNSSVELALGFELSFFSEHFMLTFATLYLTKRNRRLKTFDS